MSNNNSNHEIAPGRLSSVVWLDMRGCNCHNRRVQRRDGCNDAFEDATHEPRAYPVSTP